MVPREVRSVTIGGTGPDGDWSVRIIWKGTPKSPLSPGARGRSSTTGLNVRRGTGPSRSGTAAIRLSSASEALIAADSFGRLQLYQQGGVSPDFLLPVLGMPPRDIRHFISPGAVREVCRLLPRPRGGWAGVPPSSLKLAAGRERRGTQANQRGLAPSQAPSQPAPGHRVNPGMPPGDAAPS